MKKYFGIFFTAALGAAIALGIDHSLKKDPFISEQSPVQYKQVTYVPGPEQSINFVAAAEQSINAVVHVKTTFRNSPQTQYYDPFRDFFWGPQPRNQYPQQSSGSGVIISGDGYIVTNNHVVENGETIEIILNDKRTFKAKIIGTDPSTDLALLKIEGQSLSYIMYGNSDEVKVGEWVLAVGNPFNLNSTVTAGIISAKARNINILKNKEGFAPIESFIQTDAAVNPGNSGGALVNSSGQLIGINAAIASNTGSYTGYSFAIPVNIVKKVVNDLIEFGEVQRGFLGVSIRDIDANFAKEKEINLLSGVYVNDVTPDGAAQAAGIRSGDIITKIGEHTVANTSMLLENVGLFRPGDKINVTVIREGKQIDVPLVLKNKDGETGLLKKEKKEVVSVLGGVFESITKEEKVKLNIENGIKIVSLQAGKLRSAGIKEGFIITAVDKRKVNTIEELQKVLENKNGGVLIEGIYPNGMKAYYAFGI